MEAAAEDEYSIANGDPLALDLTEVLEGETIASVDSMVAAPATITLANAAPNAEEFTKQGVTIAAGCCAVLFDKSGGAKNHSYLVRVVVTLSNGSARRLGIPPRSRIGGLPPPSRV